MLTREQMSAAVREADEYGEESERRREDVAIGGGTGRSPPFMREEDMEAALTEADVFAYEKEEERLMEERR